MLCCCPSIVKANGEKLNISESRKQRGVSIKKITGRRKVSNDKKSGEMGCFGLTSQDSPANGVSCEVRIELTGGM